MSTVESAGRACVTIVTICPIARELVTNSAWKNLRRACARARKAHDGRQRAQSRGLCSSPRFASRVRRVLERSGNGLAERALSQ